MNYTRKQLMKIGHNVASIWGGECYDYEVTPNSVIFFCVENGEDFITEIEMDDLENYL